MLKLKNRAYMYYESENVQKFQAITEACSPHDLEGAIIKVDVLHDD